MTKHLGEKQRRAIIDALRSERRGLDATRLAARLQLHPNTVRWHLGVLTDSGLVKSEPKRRGRGRPTVVYLLTPEGIVHERDEYRLLATMLAGAAAADPDGPARAYETGRRWGRHLMEKSSPDRRLRREEAEGKVVELLDQQGFAAGVVDDVIEMRRCPFYALAETSPEIVCTLHHGLIDGALAEVGAELVVDRLEPFVEPTLCLAHLRAPPAPPPDENRSRSA